jgi:hypothetical protein
MVIVVFPELASAVVVNVPVPAVVTVMVAVRLLAAFGDAKLYVTVYVPTGNPAAVEFKVICEVEPKQLAVAVTPVSE